MPQDFLNGNERVKQLGIASLHADELEA